MARHPTPELFRSRGGVFRPLKAQAVPCVYVVR
jgi:hypothetical protein